MRSTALAFLLAALATPAAAQQPITTDSARLAVRGGEIWYRVTGGGSGTPVILLHGGPGVSGVYLKGMEALGNERLVVRYDQLGAGKSDVVTDTALFNIPRFVAELDSLRRFLRLERFHLYGHSWGATLALEYYRAHPDPVASLVFASDALVVPAFLANLQALYTLLPDSLHRAARAKETGQPYDTLAYRAAMMEINRRHATLRPVLADMDTMFASMNNAMSDYMMGTSTYVPAGTMRDYDARPFLRTLRLPVLFVVGEHDFVGPQLVRERAALVPDARLVVIPDSGHTPQWDSPVANLEAVRSFLREVDRRQR
jgi:proline-specific peptidase